MLYWWPNRNPNEDDPKMAMSRVTWSTSVSSRKSFAPWTRDTAGWGDLPVSPGTDYVATRAATQLDGAKRWQEVINETRAKCMRRVEAFHFRNVRTETEEAEQGLIRSDDDDDWLLSGDLNCHLVMILIHPEFDLKSMTIINYYNFKIEWHSINTSSEPHWTTWIKVPINLLLKLFGSSLIIGRFDVLILIVIIVLISLFFPFWLHRHHRNLAKARQLVVFWWFLIHFNHRVP